MASSCIVEICKIEEIKTHPKADKLEIAIVKGWQTIIQKETFKVGDLIAYFPPDCILPLELSDRLDVTKYLSKQRTKSINLRSHPSHGFAILKSALPEIRNNVFGDNVAEILGVTKWEPPPPKEQGGINSRGRSRPEHPLIPKYTNIQNIRNFNRIFEDDEIVVASEKIHGTNSRVSYVWTEEKEDFEYIFGSHNIIYAELEQDFGNQQTNTYYGPLRMPNIRKALKEIKDNYKAKSVVLYGEIYGYRIQDLQYGHNIEGNISFRAFDLMIDCEYVDYYIFKCECEKYKIEMCPILFEGPYSKLKEIGFENICDKNTLVTPNICPNSPIKKSLIKTILIKIVKKIFNGKLQHKILKYINKPNEISDIVPHNEIVDIKGIIEGFVLRTTRENIDDKVGRKILKYVTNKYLTREGGSENH